MICLSLGLTTIVCCVSSVTDERVSTLLAAEVTCPALEQTSVALLNTFLILFDHPKRGLSFYLCSFFFVSSFPKWFPGHQISWVSE